MYGEIHGKKYERTNIVGAKNGTQTLALGEYTCNMDSELFEAWFANVFMKVVKWRKTIILDRARFHRETQLVKLARSKRCRLIFLPAYSPDFNPIEKLWANMKKWLKHNLDKFPSLSLAISGFFGFA